MIKENDFKVYNYDTNVSKDIDDLFYVEFKRGLNKHDMYSKIYSLFFDTLELKALNKMCAEIKKTKNNNEILLFTPYEASVTIFYRIEKGFYKIKKYSLSYNNSKGFYLKNRNYSLDYYISYLKENNSFKVTAIKKHKDKIEQRFVFDLTTTSQLSCFNPLIMDFLKNDFTEFSFLQELQQEELSFLTRKMVIKYSSLLVNNKNEFLESIKYKNLRLSNAIKMMPVIVSSVYINCMKRIPITQYDIFLNFFRNNKDFITPEKIEKYRSIFFYQHDRTTTYVKVIILLFYIKTLFFDFTELENYYADHNDDSRYFNAVDDHYNDDIEEYDEEEKSKLNTSRKLNVLKDYINGIFRSHYSVKFNLKFSYERINEEHIALAQKRDLIGLQKMNVNNIFRKITLNKLFLIETNEELYVHANYMRNCVMDYQPFVNKGYLAIYKYVDKSEKIYTTAIVLENDRFKIYEINGRFNKGEPDRFEMSEIKSHLNLLNKERVNDKKTA